MNFVFVSFIDPLLLILWLFVLGLAVPIIFYFRYFSDIDSPQLPSRRYDMEEKCKVPCIGKVKKDLPSHPKDKVLNPRNYKDIKAALADKRKIHKVSCIGKVEKDLLPDINRPHPKGSILDPRGYKGIRIIWAVLGTFFISILWACIFGSRECLFDLLNASATISVQFCFAFLVSVLFPVAVFSFFVIRGERDNKKFLYCSLIGAASLFLFTPSVAHEVMFSLALPVILFIYLIN